jgi:hypothetical protein
MKIREKSVLITQEMHYDKPSLALYVSLTDVVASGV